MLRGRVVQGQVDFLEPLRPGCQATFPALTFLHLTSLEVLTFDSLLPHRWHDERCAQLIAHCKSDRIHCLGKACEANLAGL
jgi:hypothetical protein